MPVSRPSRWAGTGLGLLLAVGCLPPTRPPVAPLPVVDLAAADVRAFWDEEYPRVWGRPFEAEVIVRPYSEEAEAISECEHGGYDAGASYCPADDTVHYAVDGYVPDLAEAYGPIGVAVVMAHEWGHAVALHAELDVGRGDSPVAEEQLADCFAGAWTAAAVEEGVPSSAPRRVDRALEALLDLRWPAGDDPDHGTALERTRAFVDGLDNGVARCASYTSRYLDLVDLGEEEDAGEQLGLAEANDLHERGMSAFLGRPLRLDDDAPEADAVLERGDWALLGAFAPLLLSDAKHPLRGDCLVGAYARAAFDGEVDGVEVGSGDLDELVGGTLVGPERPRETTDDRRLVARVEAVREGFDAGRGAC